MQTLSALAALLLLLAAPCAWAGITRLAESYQFLVREQNQGGVLYTATSGALKGRALPLSFYDNAAYWGDYVCGLPRTSCVVKDVYHSFDHTLTPEAGPAGDLQTERVYVHNGTNIYDAAVWQIAVVLGAVENNFNNPAGIDAYAFAYNQNVLLKQGHGGDEKSPVVGSHRAVTAAGRFRYNERTVSDAAQAYSYRMIARRWLATDPLVGTRYAALIEAKGLPFFNREYQPGRITWTDWKPITGENAWAFLLGPLQAAYLHYVRARGNPCIPFQSLAVQNALAILPTFAAMQSRIGALYYAPSGTIANQGTAPVHPYFVSVENNFSLYAGLRVLQATLEAQSSGPKSLKSSEKKAVDRALGIIQAMIYGGRAGGNPPTEGLLSFFKNCAWSAGEFVACGTANDPRQDKEWVPMPEPRAVDVNTWGVAALGARQVDEWFGFGAAHNCWQQIKRWGAYGVGTTLWGVGYSDQDGNGMTEQGTFLQGVLSAEWTAGAITMLRSMMDHYEKIPEHSDRRWLAQNYLLDLRKDAGDMLEGIEKLRIDIYPGIEFPGQPPDYADLISSTTKPYLYASKRMLIPFGWYANPLPSTCATAWVILIADNYNPFWYGGKAH